MTIRQDHVHRVTEDPTGRHTITVMRCCNGCGAELRPATSRECGFAMLGDPLPDVRQECSECSKKAARQ